MGGGSCEAVSMFVARLLSNSKVVTALTSRERVLCAFLQVTPARIRVVTRTPVTSACSEFPCKNAEDVFNLLAAPYEPPTEETVQNALRHFFQTKDWLGDEGVVLFELPNALCFSDSYEPARRRRHTRHGRAADRGGRFWRLCADREPMANRRPETLSHWRDTSEVRCNRRRG